MNIHTEKDEARRHSIAAKILALQVAKLGSIPGTHSGPLSKDQKRRLLCSFQLGAAAVFCARQRAAASQQPALLRLESGWA